MGRPGGWRPSRALPCQGSVLGTTLVALFLGPAPLAGLQKPDGWEVTLQPDTVRLGDHFVLEIRTVLPEPWLLRAPDSIPGLRGLEPAGAVEVLRGVPSESGRPWTIRYPLLALRAGYLPLPTLSIGVGPSGKALLEGRLESLPLPLGGIGVRSVLPGSAGGLEPSPPLILPRDPPLRTPVTALLSLLGVVLGGWGWRRTNPRRGSGGEGRGRREPTLPEPPLQARLLEILAAEPASPDDALGIFEAAVPLLRSLLEDRAFRSLAASTTPELLAVLAPRTDPGALRLLERIFREGEDARFGPGVPSLEATRRFRRDLEGWLQASLPPTEDSASPRAHA